MRDGFGIALGAGGARGWCHIGVLEALADRGFVPAGVAGCSIGALVGAAWAAHRLDALRDWALSLTRAQMLAHMDIGLGPGGVLGSGVIARLLDRIGVPDRFEDLPRPLIIVATDLASGREVWFSKGSLHDAVRASASIPGVFRPHAISGRWYLDGGLVNPVPVSAVRALGLTRIASVRPNSTVGDPFWEPKQGEGLWAQLSWPALADRLPEQVRRLLPDDVMQASAPQDGGPDYIQVITVSIDIMTEYVAATRAAADPVDLKLEAALRQVSPLEIYRAEEGISEGRRLVEQAGDRLHKLRA
ncbi:MAG: patatin-like phospholipase family protein [Pseudomonadota bacterium]